MALQCLYAQRLADGSLDEIIEFVTAESDRPAEIESVEYCQELLRNVISRKEWADGVISSKLEHWDLARVTFLDQLILELALVEMVHIDAVPLKVSISEAIEIAKIYSTEDSPGFINGILDAIYHDILEGKITNLS